MKISASFFNFREILRTIVGSILSGIILALIFFLVKEIVFPMPNLNGKWYIQTKTVQTAYNPYKNMKLRYELILWQEDNKIKGTAEKFIEITANGEKEYLGAARTRSTLEGYIENNYITDKKVYIHAIENGTRQSTNFYELILESDSEMIGDFGSTVAKQKGEVIIRREPF